MTSGWTRRPRNCAACWPGWPGPGRRAAGGAAEYQARRLAGLIASLLQGALLVRHAPPPVAGAFCASRLGSASAGGPGYAFGTLPDGLELMPVVDRARASVPHGS